MLPPLLHALATAAWTLNIAAARVRAHHTVSVASQVIVLYGIASVFITWVTRRRSPQASIVVGYGLWLPLAYLTTCYDYHSLVPRVPLLAVVAWIPVLDAARRGFLVGPFLACATVLSLVAAADAAWPRPLPAVILEKNPPRLWQSDALLGYRPLADTSATVTCWHEGEKLYSVTHTFDSLGRRWTPDGDDDRPVRHAILAGNSCIFGENVPDEETLPAHVAAATRGSAVYNYGFIGWGPQHLLARLASGEVAGAVPERSGFLLYGCLADHVRRVAGFYSPMAWGANFPRYVERNGVLTHRGSFASSQPHRIAWFRFLRSSPSLDLVATRLEHVAGIPPGAWHTLVAVLKECALEYHRQFDGAFVVFFWPFDDPAPPVVKRSLEADGIMVIDLRELGVPPPRPDELVPFDPHPSGAYYANVSAALVKALADRGLMERGEAPHPHGPQEEAGRRSLGLSHEAARCEDG